MVRRIHDTRAYVQHLLDEAREWDDSRCAQKTWRLVYALASALENSETMRRALQERVVALVERLEKAK